MPRATRLTTVIAAWAALACWPGGRAGGWGFGGSDDLEPSDSKTRRIVVFDASTTPAGRAAAVARAGGAVISDLGLIHGVAARFPESRVQDIHREPGVKRVDEDLVVQAIPIETAGKSGSGTTPQPAQQTPWGIARIKAPEAWGATQGAAVNVAIVDTGIELSHPDLADNIKGGINTINLVKSYGDDNGHGTHVAGIAAARNNTFGVVGTGPLIHLYSVKVLGRSGTGFLSDIIEGLQWCVQNGIKVANMSLGSSSGNASFQEAVAAARQGGVTLVAAAGNDSGGPVSYPARYPEVIAVTASNASDAIASFSSVGPEVDLIAPGQSVLSTYKGKTYATLSGTSMAAPHVAGAAALKLAISPALTPAEVAAALAASAEPLAGLSAGQQGAGLVNCQKLAALP